MMTVVGVTIKSRLLSNNKRERETHREMQYPFSLSFVCGEGHRFVVVYLLLCIAVE